MKFCKDCKWCKPERYPVFFIKDYAFAKCVQPTICDGNHNETSLVTGKVGLKPPQRRYCHLERSGDQFGAFTACGKDAKLWEAK